MKKGFSIPQVLVAVAVVGLLVAISIPTFLEREIIENEDSAVTAVKAIASAVKNYKAATGNLPKDLLVLASLKPPYLEAGLTTGSKNGYNFFYKITGPNNFMVIARPQVYRSTGIKSFFSDGFGPVRYTKTDTEPRITDSSLQYERINQ